MVSEARKKGHTRLSPLYALEKLTSRQSPQVFDKPKMDPAKGLERMPTPLQDSDFLQGHLAMPLPMLRGISKARRPGLSLSDACFLIRSPRLQMPLATCPWPMAGPRTESRCKPGQLGSPQRAAALESGPGETALPCATLGQSTTEGHDGEAEKGAQVRTSLCWLAEGLLRGLAVLLWLVAG